MTCKDSVKWLESLKNDLGKSQFCELWHYEQALTETIELLKSDRLIELPCNIGDTLYDILEFVEQEKNPTLVKNKIDKITIAKGRTGFNFIINGLVYYPSDFGVNIFTDLIKATEKVKELNNGR